MLGMLMSQTIPLLTLTLVCMWYEESTPPEGETRHDKHISYQR